MTIVPVQNLSTWQNIIGLILKKVMQGVFFFFFCHCVTFSEKQEIDDAIQQGLSRGNES